MVISYGKMTMNAISAQISSLRVLVLKADLKDLGRRSMMQI